MLVLRGDDRLADGCVDDCDYLPMAERTVAPEERSLPADSSDPARVHGGRLGEQSQRASIPPIVK